MRFERAGMKKLIKAIAFTSDKTATSIVRMPVRQQEPRA